jgi:hypothetical protein
VNLTGMTTAFSLFGVVYNGTLKNIHIASGAISATTTGGVSGIAGECKNVTFINCFNAANITNNGTGTTAGICTSFSGTMTGCYNTGTITSAGDTGGIIGSISNPSINTIIRDCYNTGAIHVNGSGAVKVGGIVATFSSGQSGPSSIIACYNEGSVSVTSTANTVYAGGIVGQFNGAVSYDIMAYIIACYNKGAVSGTASTANYVGGIIGFNMYSNRASITASYNSGSLSATNGTVNIGGIVGYSDNSEWFDGTPLMVVACYWKSGAGATVGINVSRLAIPTTTQFSSSWPTTSASSEWGIGDGSGSGKYWKTLGSSPSTYPKLWFES